VVAMISVAVAIIGGIAIWIANKAAKSKPKSK
jgi:hypothetical protein